MGVFSWVGKLSTFGTVGGAWGWGGCEMGWEVVVYFWDSRRDVGVGLVRDGGLLFVFHHSFAPV